MNAYVKPAENMDAVLNEQHVITLATEAALDAQESLDGVYASGATLLTTTNTLKGHDSDIDALRVRPCPLRPPRDRPETAPRHDVLLLFTAPSRLLTNRPTSCCPSRLGWPSSRATTTPSTLRWRPSRWPPRPSASSRSFASSASPTRSRSYTPWNEPRRAPLPPPPPHPTSHSPNRNPCWQFAYSISGLPIVTNLPTLSATKEIDLGKA